jgi:peroxiredoxin
MEIGAEENLDALGAFTLPRFSVYESNADRLDLFDAETERQIVYFFTCAGSLAGHLHALASTEKQSKELCKQHAIDAQKEINELSELGDHLLRDLRKLVSKKRPTTISRA